MAGELLFPPRFLSGAIVNNASVGALTGNPGVGSYIASKHGVVGLTRTAALEYIKHGIRVNAVNPGLIDTQIARDVVSGDEQACSEIAKNVPIGRAGRPEEIASVVLWLCSPGASYVVGHALTVDGDDDCTLTLSPRYTLEKTLQIQGTMIYGPRDVRFVGFRRSISVLRVLGAAIG